MWEGRPPRVKGFDYRGYQRYLITLTTRFRARSFAESRAADALAAQIGPFFAARHLDVLAYCVMPDHLHLLLEGTSDGADLREAVRAWKQRTAYDWKVRTGLQLWQPGFHDRVLRRATIPLSSFDTSYGTRSEQDWSMPCATTGGWGRRDTRSPSSRTMFGIGSRAGSEAGLKTGSYVPKPV